jgi:hypothetical protein
MKYRIYKIETASHLISSVDSPRYKILSELIDSYIETEYDSLAEAIYSIQNNETLLAGLTLTVLPIIEINNSGRIM